MAKEDLERLQDLMVKFQAYAAPGFKPKLPEEVAVACLAAIERSSLAAGSGGSFLSHNGTKRWI